ncbi:MAG: GNAT family N-acetyltransferase [Chloroflexi bacterium]|nr:GNAT family N-acetyltransferase [Chloroflexota bacterium]
MVREAIDVKIIDAREEHVPFIAWVQLTAFRSHLPMSMWDFFIDSSEDDVLRFLEALATTETQHWASYQGFMIAEVDGTPAAAMTGYFEAESSFMQGIAEACRTTSMTDRDIAAGWKRADTIELVGTPHAPGAWITENVATKPEFRRRGLVDRLLAEMMERGRAKGATIGEIGVFIGNDNAQRAYEKAGYEVVDEKRHPDFEAVYGCPGVRQLRREL